MSDAPSAHETSHSLGDTPIGQAVRMRERMRTLIHDEVERLNPTDDARRALELIIESSVRPSEVGDELRLTVIDARGHMRIVERDGKKIPFSLQDLLDELRAAHPILFKGPPKPKALETKSEPSTEAERIFPNAQRDWLRLDTPESDSEEKPAASFSAKPPALQSKGMAWFRGWSKKRTEEGKTSPALKDSYRIVASNELAQSAERAQAFFDNLDKQPLSRRPGFALSVVTIALLLIGAGTFLLLHEKNGTRPGVEDPSQTSAISSGHVASTQVPASNSSSGRILRGVPDVIDTATLSLDGEVVRLFGVEWAPGAGKPEDLTNYLQGREVTCEPAGGNDTYRCRVGGQDLSRVILYNGGGQPSPDATPELKAAADQAREAKLGVWSSQP